MRRMVFPLLLAGALFLTACGGGSQTFQTTTGVKVTAENTWQELSGDDARSLLEGDNVSIETMVMALQKKNKEASMTIDRYDAGPIIRQYDNFLSNLQDEYQDDWEGAKIWLYENDYVQREIDLLEPFLKNDETTDEQKTYLMQELFEQDWMYDMEHGEPKITMQVIDVEDEQIANQRVQVFHVRYKNLEGDTLDQYDTILLKGSSVYQIIQWTNLDDSKKLTEEFKEIRANLTIPD